MYFEFLEIYCTLAGQRYFIYPYVFQKFVKKAIPVEHILIDFLGCVEYLIITKTSLLRRLQAQTLPNETPPIGKIHPYSKITVTFEPIQLF